MSEYYRDTWNDASDIDFDSYDKEVTSLENEVHDLKLEIDGLRDDSIFVLSELMLIRDDIDRGFPLQIIRGELEKLMSTYSPQVREKAIERIAERFEP
jgi:hypothetical protein